MTDRRPAAQGGVARTAAYAESLRRGALRLLVTRSPLHGLLLVGGGMVLGVVLMLLVWPEEPSGVVARSKADVHILITSGYMTRRIQAQAATLGIHHLRVGSVPPSVLRADMEWGTGWLSVPAVLRVQPVPHRGKLQLRVLSAQVAGVPVPPGLAQILAGSLNASTQQLLGPRVRIVGVTVTPRGLEVAANYPAR